MTLTAVVILILIGVLLMLIEFLVLPGTNIAGIVGIVLIVGGIYFSYKDVGVPQAHFVLVGTFILVVGSIVLALRSDTWSKLSLKTSINSKVENIEPNSVKPGDVGKTISRLAPVGKVLVNNEVCEAKSGHQFLDPNVPVIVVKVKGNQIVVKPIE
jgi:membrane-bound ClpP family serine protease